jgi:hypothetical protein
MLVVAIKLIMMKVIMLTVIMLTVVKLIIVAPHKEPISDTALMTFSIKTLESWKTIFYNEIHQKKSFFFWHRDILHNGIQHNDTQNNEIHQRKARKTILLVLL